MRRAFTRSACLRLVPCYHITMVRETERRTVERVQTGVRMERRILKILKAIADYHDLSLGDLLEGIVLHAFEGKAPFGKQTLGRIGELKKLYALDLDATDSHKLREKGATR